MIQWIVTSSVLILVVIALRYLLRGKISLKMQYALWLLVLVRLLVPVSFGTSDVSVMNAVPANVPVISQPAQPAGYEPAAGPKTPVQSAGDPVQQPAQNTAPAVSEPEPKTPQEIDWARLGMGVYFAGAAALGLVFLASNLRFARALRRSRRRTELTALLPVYESGATETPCLFGLCRPAIYLTPSTLTDGDALRYSLAHEQTHYLHHDQLWSALRGVCLALHWYNPLVWWAAELSRRDAELACDESTIGHLGESERASYGRTLLRMTCEKRPALLVTATMMTDSGRGLRERITLLVKKPKTAAYAAVALVLVAVTAVACTFTGKTESDLPSPFGRTYRTAEVVYQAPEYDFTLTAGTAPSFRFEKDGQATVVIGSVDDTAPDLERTYGAFEDYSLTKASFDDRFRTAEDGTSGWADGTLNAAKLRRENAQAWHCTATGDISWPEELYLLQQKDGTLYLIMGYDWDASERFPDGLRFFRWMFRLNDPLNNRNSTGVYASMDDYAADIVSALTEAGGYAYDIVPAGSRSDSGNYETVIEAAEDVRITGLYLEASCGSVCPEGSIELWYFDYAVKPVDSAGALPERFFWAGGNSISGDGYIDDGLYYYLTVLHRSATDDYTILRTALTNDGLWYNGSSYSDACEEYLYDFYADYAMLDLPRYHVPDFLSEDDLLSEGVTRTSEDTVGYRYDGSAYILYTTRLFTYAGEPGADRWESIYSTGSALCVDKSTDSTEMMETFYRDNGFTLAQYREGSSLSGPWLRYDADSGTQFANYLAPNAEEGGCYIISAYWQPTDDASRNQWGYSKKNQITNESVMLRAMAQSFMAVSPESCYASYTPSFEADVSKQTADPFTFVSGLALYMDPADAGSYYYPTAATWNPVWLGSCSYTPCDAYDAPQDSLKLDMILSNNDQSWFTFYEGTNIVAYRRGGENAAEYYLAEGDFSIMDNDGRTLFDAVRSWYDEAEYFALHNAIEPIDKSLSWQEAAQQWADRYYGAALNVTAGSKYKYTWVKTVITPADDTTAQLRKSGTIDENSYCFYTNTAFVAESALSLNYSMAGNTGPCEKVPDAPEGAYEYSRCCVMYLDSDGWYGQMWGTGW